MTTANQDTLNQKNDVNPLNNQEIRKYRNGDEYYLEFAFTLFDIISRLYGVLLDSKVKDIVFLAREGFFLKKLFDEYRLINSYKGNDHIKSHYLLVSRKSTILANLNALDIEDFRAFHTLPRITVRRFMDVFGYPESEVEDTAVALGVKPGEEISDFFNTDIFNRIIHLPRFHERYEKARAHQKEYLTEYLYDLDLNVKADGLHLMDIGWKGTIQSNIYELFNRHVPVSGYYMGVNVDQELYDDNKKIGLLFAYSLSDESSRSSRVNVYLQDILLYEYLLMAGHGSISYYEKCDNRIIPIFEDNPIEREIYFNNIRSIQQKMLTVFRVIAKVFAESGHVSSEYDESFYAIHRRMMWKHIINKEDFYTDIHNKMRLRFENRNKAEQ
ncbi:hypothetical protein FACS1894105_13340 [Clostridia bacterium]|nr:hypothetical protein FACS1894105_13340 [Clostridia bacterium]